MTSTVWISVRWSCHIWKAKRHLISDLRNESQELKQKRRCLTAAGTRTPAARDVFEWQQ